MLKTLSTLIFILVLFGCKSSTELIDYLGQPYPSATPEVFAPNIVSIKGRFEHGISFTPNIKELAFGILNEDGSGNIYYSKKNNDTWMTPEVFKPLENKSVFLPYFSPNGKSLLYAQSIPDTNNLNITNIWKIENSNGHWILPKKMQTPIHSTSREANASMTYDSTIYFSSNRNCHGKENCYTADLFYSKLVDNVYESVEQISQLNSSGDKESVFISPKEDYIIFCTYTDNKTWMDLYISYRDINKKWLAPVILDTTINSEYWDRRPFVSIDNKYLFYTQLQIDEKGLTESDIFWVNTTKLFKPFVFNPISNITVQVGKTFNIPIPINYFKDIDNNLLHIDLNKNELNWLKFDAKKMQLSGLPNETGDFELTFSAVDAFSNLTKDKITLTVKK